VYRGKFISQFIIHYHHSKDTIGSIVRVKLHRDSDILDFDVFFARIPPDGPANGMDITLNWRSLDINNNGVFYTDANGYKIVKRNITDRPTPKPELKTVQIPTFFYPVSSAIFVEDELTRNQMVVMNDRP